MLFLKNRSKFHIVFFKSRIKSSSGIGILFGLIAQMAIDPEYQTPVIQMINKLLLFIPIGMLFKILIEEIDNKDRYYFYYNQGITKIELWITSFIFSFSYYFIFYLIFTICRHSLRLIV